MFITRAYPLVHDAHVLLVGLSGALFAARGLGVQLGMAWAMARKVRMASVYIDVALLAAGVWLWFMLGFHPLHDTWLGVKLGLLVVYILLGTMALKRAKGRLNKAAFFLLALGCYGWMISIAVTKHPLGFFKGVLA
ncbi:SirB2 family protein [Hydrogenophaga sp. 5NK40-0174]|uniref:SirB2 family protein n=1 Tax=Hydrogenophaga sp. 5NK40-0174 TaxID=3127649 RepID=UPI003101F870